MKQKHHAVQAKLLRAVAAIAPDRVIAMGKYPETVLKRCNIQFTKIVHPSAWDDESAIAFAQIIKGEELTDKECEKLKNTDFGKVSITASLTLLLVLAVWTLIVCVCVCGVVSFRPPAAHSKCKTPSTRILRLVSTTICPTVSGVRSWPTPTSKPWQSVWTR
jgi:hypothetical protein